VIFLPVLNKKKNVIAIIEISELSSFEGEGLDEEYLGKILANFCSERIETFTKLRLLKEENLIKN